jgi:hypothetical protein
MDQIEARDRAGTIQLGTGAMSRGSMAIFIGSGCDGATRRTYDDQYIRAICAEGPRFRLVRHGEFSWIRGTLRNWTISKEPIKEEARHERRGALGPSEWLLRSPSSSNTFHCRLRHGHLCRSHSIGKGFITSCNDTVKFCRPCISAPTKAGANNVSLSTRLTYEKLTLSTSNL